MVFHGFFSLLVGLKSKIVTGQERDGKNDFEFRISGVNVNEVGGFKETLQIAKVTVLENLKGQGIFPTMQLTVATLIDTVEDYFGDLQTQFYFDTKNKSKSLSPGLKLAGRYNPIRSRSFFNLMLRLNVDSSLSFVDIGAGAGKPMILASQFGFAKVRGVEIAPELCQVAQDNFSKVDYENFDLHCQDALEFEFQKNDALILMNDPFQHEVMKEFIPKLEAFARTADHPVVLAYKNCPRYKINELESLKARVRFEQFVEMGNFFEIYWLRET